MITGFDSYHNNGREDRRWRIYSGQASKVSCLAKGWSGWANRYDKKFSFSCPTNHALFGVKSIHSNHNEDRRWKFLCCGLSSNAYMKTGGWTNYVNGWDDRLNYQCPGSNEVLVGVSSYHNNRFEDRRWKFRCGQVRMK